MMCRLSAYVTHIVGCSIHSQRKFYWNDVATTACNIGNVTPFQSSSLTRDKRLGAFVISIPGKELKQNNSLLYTARQELGKMTEDRNSLAKENLARESHTKTNTNAMAVIKQLQAQVFQMLPLQQQLYSTQQRC